MLVAQSLEASIFGYGLAWALLLERRGNDSDTPVTSVFTDWSKTRGRKRRKKKGLASFP